MKILSLYFIYLNFVSLTVVTKIIRQDVNCLILTFLNEVFIALTIIINNWPIFLANRAYDQLSKLISKRVRKFIRIYPIFPITIILFIRLSFSTFVDDMVSN